MGCWNESANADVNHETALDSVDDLSLEQLAFFERIKDALPKNVEVCLLLRNNWVAFCAGGLQDDDFKCVTDIRTVPTAVSTLSSVSSLSGTTPSALVPRSTNTRSFST